MLRFIPPNLRGKTYVCQNCKKPQFINWFKDRGSYTGSLKSLVEDGYWAIESAIENCPSCEFPNKIPIPVIQKKFNYHLFGDEAFRELNGKAMLFTYSLIGASQGHLPEIESEIWNIKKELLPNFSPDEWVIHMKDLWSGHNRKKNKYFMNLTQQDVQNILIKIGELVSRFGQKLYKANILLVGKPRNNSNAEKRQFDAIIKNEAYTGLIFPTIELVTSFGGEPKFIFDADRPVESGTVIQQWAKKAYDGSSSTILNAFLTHSIPVNEPIFVPPGSRPLLELADVLCFVVARYNHKLYLKESADVDCSIFGEVNYYTYMNKGKILRWLPSNNYPFPIDWP